MDTGGSINIWNYTLTEEDDGDTYFQLILPYWPSNQNVVRKVLRTAYEASKMNDVFVTFGLGPLNAIHGLSSFRGPNPDEHPYILIMFYKTVCDPD